jgi:hypothetical protein
MVPKADRQRRCRQHRFLEQHNGQNVIKAFNGGASSTTLSQWLTTTFANLYGAATGGHSLVNLTNSQIASAYTTKFTPTSKSWPRQ